MGKWPWEEKGLSDEEREQIRKEIKDRDSNLAREAKDTPDRKKKGKKG